MQVIEIYNASPIFYVVFLVLNFKVIFFFLQFFFFLRTIYEKLSEALNEDEVILYKQRVDELIPNIRYCAYNIGDETAINDLMKLRLSGKTSGEDLLAADLDVRNFTFINLFKKYNI